MTATVIGMVEIIIIFSISISFEAINFQQETLLHCTGSEMIDNTMTFLNPQFVEQCNL
jgi:hypothetical protein